MANLFVEALTVIDCALLDSARGLIGESWIVDLELGGELDDQGMVLDFGTVKKQIKQLIDAEIDHRLLIPTRAAELSLKETSNSIDVEFSSQTGNIIHHSPTEAVCKIDSIKIDQDSVSQFLHQLLSRRLPSNINSISLGLRNETSDQPYFHYCHGLKKHGGNCQRIAHGHRSRIEISIDGSRNPNIERAWVKRWRDIYIATTDDETNTGEDATTLQYQSEQGEFYLILNPDRVYWVDGDTTIERLAQHLADQCKSEFPDSKVEVRLFEGVHKGALAIS